MAVILALGLGSPLCLCGEVVSEAHAVKAQETCGHGGAGHGETGEVPHSEDHPEGEHHCAADSRSNLVNSIAIPDIASTDLAAWQVSSPIAVDGADEARPLIIPCQPEPDLGRIRSAAFTGAFLL